MATSTTRSSARVTLLALVVVAGGLTALAIVQRDRALDRAYEDAEVSGGRFASTTVRSALIPTDLDGPIESARAQQVDAEIDEQMLTDPAIARVRVWGLDGTLLFSTDPADDVGVVGEDPEIQLVASQGTTTSRRVVDAIGGGEPQSGAAGTPLLQTFAPLELRGETEPRAVAEIDQFAAELEDRANDPWGTLQIGASAATGVLALLALVSLFRSSRGGRRRPERAVRRSGFGGDAVGASSEADEPAVTARETGPSDQGMLELREALRRSEAERALLRAGRPETLVEVELRQLRRDLQEARSRARAAEALAAGKGDLSDVQEQLAAADRDVERAGERASLAERRADAAEDQARLTAELATAAEQRIDLLEAKLQELAAAGALASQDGSELAALREELAAANERAAALEQRAAETEALAAAAAEARSAEAATASVAPEDAETRAALEALEERVAEAEAQTAEAEARLRTFEGEDDEGGSSYRHTLGIRAAGRKLAAPAAAIEEDREPDPETALRSAIGRGLRGPLTRASGLTLSLQASVGSAEGKRVLRQLSSALRRLDQLSADLHDVARIEDGTLRIDPRRTDVTSLLTTTLEEADQLQEDRLVRLDAERLHATADPGRLRQVVEGMLEAAHDRTRPGAAIVVRARRIETGVRISVEDDNRTPAVIGPDMSLTVRIAELMGTEIVADGSTYSVVLPSEDG